MRSVAQSPRRPTVQDTEVGSRLKARRNAAGLTQEQLANAFGVSYQQVQKYEKGASRMSTGRLRQAATLLGTTIQDLVGEADPVAAPGFAEVGGAAYDALEGEASDLLRHFEAIKDKGDRAMLVRMARLLARA